MPSQLWIVLAVLVTVLLVVGLSRFAPVKRFIVRLPGLRTQVDLQEKATTSFTDEGGDHTDSRFTVSGSSDARFKDTTTKRSTFDIQGTPDTGDATGDDES